MTYVALFCLVVILLSCLAALAWQHFHENWAQNVGLVLLGIGAGLRFDQLLERQHVSWIALLVYIGLALYLTGTAAKAWRMNKKPQNGGKHAASVP